MSALRSPRNLTRELLEPVQRLDSRGEQRRKSRSGVSNAPRHPTAVIAEVEAQMLAVTGEVNVALLAAVRPLLRGDGTASPEEIKKAIQRVRLRVPSVNDKDATKVAVQNLGKVDHFNRRDVQRSIGVAVPEFSAPIGEKWRREHVALIKSIPEEAKTRFTGILRDASKRQSRVETIKGLLEEQLGVNDRRARLIARDQILTLNAKLNEDRHKRAGVTEYIWRTVGDGSVRSNHSHLNGEHFKYADPPIGGGTSESDRGNPGTGIGCRCQAIPVIPEFEAAAPRRDPNKRNPLAFSTSQAAGPTQQRRAPAPPAPPATPLARPRQAPTRTPLPPEPRAPAAAIKKASKASAVAKANLQKQIAKTAAVKKKLGVAAPPQPTHKEWVATRTPEDKKAFSYWSEEGYEHIRAIQRGEAVASAHHAKLAKESIASIDKAFETAPPHQGRIYRGLSLPQEVADQYAKASSMKMDELTSFSEKLGVAQNFASGKDQVSVILELEAKNTRAVNISSMSEIGEESEVLVKQGETFKVTGTRYDEDNGVLHILLSE